DTLHCRLSNFLMSSWRMASYFFPATSRSGSSQERKRLNKSSVRSQSFFIGESAFKPVEINRVRTPGIIKDFPVCSRITQDLRKPRASGGASLQGRLGATLRLHPNG